MKQVRIATDAKAELAEILDWYLREAGIAVRRAFQVELKGLKERLAEQPLAYPLISETVRRAVHAALPLSDFLHRQRDRCIHSRCDPRRS